MADVLNTVGDVNTGAPEGHDQAMLDAVAQKEAELAGNGKDAPAGDSGEEKLLGKFNSADELAKAYQELERKLSEKGNDKPKPEDGPTDLTEDKANELVEAAGLNMDQMAEHYYDNGGLSDDHYEALEKAGIPRAYVDQYIAGVEAQAAQMRDQIFQEVGGEDQFAVMAQWAAANLSDDELSQYNEAVDSGDMSVVRSAVMSLAFRYQREAGRDPQLVGGGNGAVGGFESLAQLTEAMKDPRYEKDPAYRREVETKLARSTIF